MTPPLPRFVLRSIIYLLAVLIPSNSFAVSLARAPGRPGAVRPTGRPQGASSHLPGAPGLAAPPQGINGSWGQGGAEFPNQQAAGLNSAFAPQATPSPKPSAGSMPTNRSWDHLLRLEEDLPATSTQAEDKPVEHGLAHSAAVFDGASKAARVAALEGPPAPGKILGGLLGASVALGAAPKALAALGDAPLVTAPDPAPSLHYTSWIGEWLAPLLKPLHEIGAFEAWTYIPAMSLAAWGVWRALRARLVSPGGAPPGRLAKANLFAVSWLMTNTLAVAFKTMIVEELDYGARVWFEPMVSPLHFLIAAASALYLWLMTRASATGRALAVSAAVQASLAAGYALGIRRLFTEDLFGALEGAAMLALFALWHWDVWRRSFGSWLKERKRRQA